jgi:hypothetical protein
MWRACVPLDELETHVLEWHPHQAQNTAQAHGDTGSPVVIVCVCVWGGWYM